MLVKMVSQLLVSPGFTFCTNFRLRLRHFTAQDVSLTNDLLSRCYIGDWFLLHLLAKNTSTYMFRDVYQQLRMYVKVESDLRFSHDHK